MSPIRQRLAELGIALPETAPLVANYAPVIVHGNLAIVSGQLPRTDAGLVTGQVGIDLDLDGASAAARLCGIAILAALDRALGAGLEQVERCLQLSGFVSAPPEFRDHSKVINGASDLMVEVFGPAGMHARAAVGVPSLPLGAAIEVAATFAVA